MPDDPPTAAGDGPSPDEWSASSGEPAAALAEVLRLSADLVRLSVGAVSRRLGVASPTLRTWDRRYGLGPSGRTEGSHRRYTAEDVSRLALMRRLVRSGIAPSEAARVALLTTPDQLAEAASPDDHDAGRTARRLTGVPQPTREVEPAVAVGLGIDLSAEEVERLANEFVLPMPDRSGPTTWGQGSFSGETYRSTTQTTGPPAPRVSAGARVLARALLTLDAAAITEIVTDAVDRQGVVGAWESLIAPGLRAVGRRWAEQQDGIELEHVFAECVVSVLRRRSLDLAGEPANASPVLLSCSPEDQHSLPLHALAAALAERRIACVVLGPRVPAGALANAVLRAAPCLLFVWSQMASTAALDVASLTTGGSSMPIVAGGPGWDPADLPAQVLPVTEFGRAVELLCTLAH